MPRIARMVVEDEPAVYHVMSRTALDGFVLGDMEKDYLLALIRRLAAVYFAEVMGFCIMGNHFHLVVKMHSGKQYSADEIKNRYEHYYGDGKEPGPEQIPALREKWESLSEFIKDIKQSFSRFYNRKHNRRGFFWGERFKSVIVENGETLINLLAYVDLNPVRAGIFERPENYRWCSLGYHLQTNNKDDFLSLDFGLREFGIKTPKERLNHYREFVHAKGGIDDTKDKTRESDITTIDRFRCRTRYFADSGIIGSKEFVGRLYTVFKGHFSSIHEKKGKAISGLQGVYSLKRLYGEG